ncbi:hypothetical protein FBY35_3975 [Streptomyces sp. SLBN-118]|uniref:hypothetical protein n=1 Tax=Streptomyces sp. SLBN-118 TaxID=2768454 RepID=UPI0011677E30|nr:hypothetical protein [Streptomyces sp. SLBN-118]TQK42553.1 hypothetical protein FBY35_3975 [Streptomyces sp. SLBN-118]
MLSHVRESSGSIAAFRLGPTPTGAARIESSWSSLPGRRALLADANHWALTDYGSLVAWLQTTGLVTATARAALVGSGDPVVTLAEVRRRVGTFSPAICCSGTMSRRR